MKLDYLNGTPYTIEQPQDMYHFNSDTELLGRFMRLKASDAVLDIGCSTGALLCYAAVQHPQKLYGIDLFEDVIQQAEKNLQHNQIQAELYTGKVQAYEPGFQFDVIISNPPFFHTENEALKNDNPYLAAARHESFLTMKELFAAVSRLLKEDGVFYVVHRAQRISELIETASQFQLVPVRIRMSYKRKNGPEAGVLICFSHGSESSVKMDPPVYLDDRSTFADTKGEGR
jgi:tRNA1(Val) A37 N6-methylase TrmN6